MHLYERVNYTADINFLTSTYIREYDISKANINILYKKGVISKQQYEFLYNAPNQVRKVHVGLFLRDNPRCVQILKDGIIEAKKMFFLSNDIKEEDVLAIKNDAIFLINKIANVTKFDNIEFKCKNTYTSYYKIGPLEMYYYLNTIENKEKIDIKGINDIELKKHEEYFLDFLLACFYSVETEKIEETIDIVVNFYQKYLALDLDIGYYREFNSLSRYTFKPISDFTTFTADFLDNNNKPQVNINYNMEIIRTLFQYYSFIQMNKR